MRKKATFKLLAVGAAAALALSGCTSTSSGGQMMDKLGNPEKTVSLLGWPGYAEDGSNDPNYDWVTPFEKETTLGDCKAYSRNCSNDLTRLPDDGRIWHG